MLIDDGLTFREIVMKDPLPKGVIQQSVIDFLKGREDAAIRIASRQRTGR